MNQKDFKYYLSELEAYFHEEGYQSNSYHRDSGIMFLNLDKPKLNFMDEFESAEDRLDHLVYFHELTHAIQSTTTIYGISQFLLNSWHRHNTYLTLRACKEQNKLYRFPILQYLEKESQNEELNILARQYQYNSFLIGVMEGKISYQTITKSLDSKKQISDSVYFTEVGYAIDKGFIGIEKIILNLKHEDYKWLFSGALSIKELWAVLASELQDWLMSSVLKKNDEEYEYAEVFDRKRLAAEDDIRFKIYTYLFETIRSYLDVKNPYDIFNSVVKMLDYILMNTSFYSGVNTISLSKLRTPDHLLKNILDILKEKKIELSDSKYYKSGKTNFFEDEINIINEALKFPDQQVVIKNFLKNTFYPIVEQITTTFPNTPDKSFFNLAEKALKMRIEHHDIFTNNYNFNYKEKVNNFVGHMNSDGGLLILLNDKYTKGKHIALDRWFLSELNNQIYTINEIVCPMVSKGIFCPHKEEICKTNVSNILTYKIKNHKNCILSMHIGFWNDIIN